MESSRHRWQASGVCLLIGVLGTGTIAKAADYSWTGTATANWASSNWSGTPTVDSSTGPVSTDNAFFSQTTARVINFAGSREIGNFTNNASVTVTLQSGVANTVSTFTAGTIENSGSSFIALRNGNGTAFLDVITTNLTLDGAIGAGYNLGNTASAETNSNWLRSLNVSGETKVVQGTVNINVRNADNASNTYSLGLLNMAAGTVNLNYSYYSKNAVANILGLSGSGGTITGASTASGGTNSGASSLIITNAANYSSGTVLSDGTSGGKLSLTKSGAGIQVLTSNNTYTGGTTITEGRLQLGDGGATGNIVGAVSMTGASAELAFNRSDSSTFSGVIGGSGKVVQAGSGTTILSGANTFTGGTLIEAGTLQVANDGNLGDAGGTVGISGGGALSFTAGTNSFNRATTLGAGGGRFNLASNTVVTWAGAIGGTGGLTKGGSASTGAALYLTGANTYQGGTVIEGGVLRIDSDQNLGDAAGGITFNNGVNTARLETMQDTISNRAMVLNGALVTLSASGTSTAQWNGQISGSGGINKTFSGTVVLGGSNTYEGGTTVSAGTLLVTNTSGSGTGTGAVTVNATRVLGGTGIIAPGAGNNVSVSGVLSPGVGGEGSLKLDFSDSSKLDLLAGSSIDMTLGTNSTQISFLSVGDWLSGSGNAILSLTLGTGFSYDNSYVVFSNVSTGGFAFADVTGYDKEAYTHSFNQVEDDYVLTFTAVPEPTTALLVGLAGCAAFYLRKRKDA